MILQKHDVPEDLKHRLELLIALTENGRDITNFEEKVSVFVIGLVTKLSTVSALPFSSIK